MAKLYAVALSVVERLLLQQTIKKRKVPARTTTRARILLKADVGPKGPEWTDATIAEEVEVSRPTVERLRKRAVTEGIEAELQDRPKWEKRHGKLNGEQEARLTALACSTPPAGQKRWTLHLLTLPTARIAGLPVASVTGQTGALVLQLVACPQERAMARGNSPRTPCTVPLPQL